MQRLTNRIKTRRYFLRLAELQESVPKPDLFAKLSPELQQSLLMETHRSWVTCLPFFHALQFNIVSGVQCLYEMIEQGENLLAAIALRMKPALYIARERAKSDTLYVIVKGIMIDVYTKEVRRLASIPLDL